MANALTYPSSLPRPLLGSDASTYSDGVETSEMMFGGVRQHSLHDRLIGRQSISLRLTRIQAARLNAFYVTARAQSFDIETSVIGDPDGVLRTVSGRFLSPPTLSQTLSRNLFEVSFSLLIENIEPIYENDDDLWVYFDHADGNLDSYAQLVETTANSDP